MCTVALEKEWETLSIRLDRQNDRKEAIQEEQEVSGEFSILFCARKYTCRTHVVVKCDDVARLLKGYQSDREALEVQKPEKVLQHNAAHSADFVPYCHRLSGKWPLDLLLKGTSFYELVDDDRTNGPRNCEERRDLLAHREQNQAIQTAVKLEFLSPVKREEMIFSVKYQKTNK